MMLTLVVEVFGRKEQVRVGPVVPGEVTRIGIGEDELEVTVLRIEESMLLLRRGNRVLRVPWAPIGEGRWELGLDGQRAVVTARSGLDERVIAAGGRTGAGRFQDRIVAHMPGKIVEVLVEPGRIVEAGEVVVVLEAMKMENAVRAATRARVDRVVVSRGVSVESGALLLELGKVDDE